MVFVACYNYKYKFKKVSICHFMQNKDKRHIMDPPFLKSSHHYSTLQT